MKHSGSLTVGTGELFRRAIVDVVPGVLVGLDSPGAARLGR
jgi:hypothetical protein